MSFSTQIGLFVKQGKKAPKKTRDQVMLKLFKAVIMDTPVKDGRLRGNWQTQHFSPNLSTKSRPSKAGSSALSRARKALKFAPMRNDIYFTNNLPYAEAIENGHGGRPAGVMVQKNVLRFGQLMTREATRQRRKKK